MNVPSFGRVVLVDEAGKRGRLVDTASNEYGEMAFGRRDLDPDSRFEDITEGCTVLYEPEQVGRRWRATKIRTM